jgi:hypothetical protein
MNTTQENSTKNAAWVELYNIIGKINGRTCAVGNGYYLAFRNEHGGVTRIKFERDEAGAKAFRDWLLSA